MNDKRLELYLQRFEKVFDYIYAHLDEPLDLYRLADVACLSPYHWHRLYQGVYGETLKATVKRLRLHFAAGQLVNTSFSVQKIVKNSGYTHLASFNRAFSEVYGMPPATYRQRGSHLTFAVNPATNNIKEDDLMGEVKVCQQPAVKVIGVEHKGAYMNIGRSFEKIFGWFSMLPKDAVTGPIKTLGIYLDDPSAVAESDLRSMACMSGIRSEKLPESYRELVIAGGEYAVFQHKGPYADMQSAYQWLYASWLPQSGRFPADQPVYEEYLNNPREVAPTELLTNICIPLAPK